MFECLLEQKTLLIALISEIRAIPKKRSVVQFIKAWLIISQTLGVLRPFKSYSKILSADMASLALVIPMIQIASSWGLGLLSGACCRICRHGFSSVHWWKVCKMNLKSIFSLSPSRKFRCVTHASRARSPSGPTSLIAGEMSSPSELSTCRPRGADWYGMRGERCKISPAAVHLPPPHR